jgi:hypothetical protein
VNGHAPYLAGALPPPPESVLRALL